jgi:hypothetical protein
MLIFTYKLEKYITKKVLPKILLNPKKYVIKGSFRRKIPYVTDIDIVNNVYPDINKNNIYDKLVELIKNLQKENDENIIFVYITCGVDERFKIETGSEAELGKIKLLLNEKEKEIFESIEKKYSNNFDKKIFYINEMIWEIYKLRWTPKNVLENKKILREGLEIKFTDIIEKNTSMLLQYFVKIESYPVGIDIVVNYVPVDLTKAYQLAAQYQLKLANYAKEYYYMLFPFKFHFKENKNISKELEDLIEKKFGLYKQLMVRIDTYHILYNTNIIDIRMATYIVSSIVKDIQHLSGFQSNVINKIKEVAQNNPPDIKIREWNTLLSVLYDEINTSVNIMAKDYFFKYYDMLPEDIKNKYYLADYRPANRRYL